jgi:hypothetical protein
MEKKILENLEYNNKVNMENTNNFECIVIRPGSIESVNWNDLYYSHKLMELDLFESVTVNSENFVEIIAKKLEIDKLSNETNINVSKAYIGEEPYYLYEMLYVDVKEEKNKNINMMATLLNCDDMKIYNNVIIFKNHLPSLSNSMTLSTVSKKDIQRLLYHRVHTKIVVYDEIMKEMDIEGDLNLFADKFFEGEHFIKKEIGFLMHNLNIWYVINEYDDNNVCGNIINKPIDKCIFFTMKNEEYRGNITLDEVNKIVYLSTILTNYMTPSELLDEVNDTMGRKIINNKYKVLDYVYDKNMSLKK